MNKNVRLILRVTVFFLIFLVFVAVFSYLFLPKHGATNFAISDMAAYGITEEPNNTLDVLVVGDSETYSSISPMCMWEDRGFTSYVCATSGQYLFDSYEFMASTLKNQKPKIIILETNAVYRKFNLNNYIGAKVARKIPIIKYHNRWKRMNLNDFNGEIAKDTESVFKGYIPFHENKPGEYYEYMKHSDKKKEIPELNQDCLKDMITLCQEYNVKLIFVSTPSLANWNYMRHNGIEAFAKENGITYLDLNLENDKISINWEKDTRDKGDHLNVKGATKVSKYLGTYLDEQYDLPDHRQDSNYADWNKGLEEYNKKIVESE